VCACVCLCVCVCMCACVCVWQGGGENGYGSGIVTSLRKFDRERQKEYHLPIIMKDSGHPAMSGTNTLTIVIGDINDNRHYVGHKDIYVYSYRGELSPYTCASCTVWERVLKCWKCSTGKWRTNVSFLSPFNGHFSRWSWVSPYQNVSILDYMGAKDADGGGDNWSYKTCKAPVKLSPPTNQHPAFYRLDVLPVAQPTVSKHWRESVEEVTEVLEMRYRKMTDQYLFNQNDCWILLTSHFLHSPRSLPTSAVYNWEGQVCNFLVLGVLGMLCTKNY